jgi:HlyD family secretion protein
MSKFSLIARTLTMVGAAAGIYGIVDVYKLQAQQTPPQVPEAQQPPVVPPTKPFAKTIAGTGIFESWGENVLIGVPTPGLLKNVFVKVNEVVAAGTPLLGLDDQEVQAALVTAKAKVAASEADVAVAQANLAKAEDFLKRLEKLKGGGGVSQDEVATREFDLRIAQAQLTASAGKLAQAQSEVLSQTLLLERLTVKAPRAGTVLQLNVRAGEFANTQGSNKNLLVLGDLTKLQVRVDVDEQNATRIRPGQKAVCYVKGDTQVSLPLKFVRVEPYIIPKVSLTGASTERVDTRVLQVIYEYEPKPEVASFVGQQVDVFIEAN